MQALILGLLLAAVLGFFVPAVQHRLQLLLHGNPLLVWTVPFVFGLFFAGVSALAGVSPLPLGLAVLAYAAAPVACVYFAGPGFVKRPGIADFLAIVLLWLPLEFGAGQTLVPRPAQGFLHSVAYGIAILLGLTLFIGFRSFPGLKCNAPRGRSDFWLPLLGYAAVAPVLIGIGIAIGFIPPPHLPSHPAGKMAAALGVIFAGTALPEEILFRSLIQNLLMLRFGRTFRVLLIASVIFGCAHLDNGPQPLPNWRYAILATVAGLAYGKVFEKGSTVLSSAGLHCLVDWTKHFFF